MIATYPSQPNMTHSTKVSPPAYLAPNSGQVLLLLLMVMAVIVTITGSAAYRATTQTKAVKESEESKKAYQGAVGYLEQALQGITITPIIGFNSGVNPVGSVAQNTDGSGSTAFTTRIAKDGMHTIYLYEYSSDANTFSAPTSLDTLSPLYYSIVGTECPVFELTFVSGATNTLTRLVTEQSEATALCSSYRLVAVDRDNVITPAVANVTINTIAYNRSITIPPALIPANAKLLIIRSLYTNATIGFTSTPASQGRKVFSTARTQEGAQKTVSIFQPHPQIPAEFFVTSF